METGRTADPATQARWRQTHSNHREIVNGLMKVIAFLRLASIGLMPRKLCSPA
jgi:hypothetical protein